MLYFFHWSIRRERTRTHTLSSVRKVQETFPGYVVCLAHIIHIMMGWVGNSKLCRINKHIDWSDFRMTLKNGFAKCSLFVSSASG